MVVQDAMISCNAISANKLWWSHVHQLPGVTSRRSQWTWSSIEQPKRHRNRSGADRDQIPNTKTSSGRNRYSMLLSGCCLGSRHLFANRLAKTTQQVSAVCLSARYISGLEFECNVIVFSLFLGKIPIETKSTRGLFYESWECKILDSMLLQSTIIRTIQTFRLPNVIPLQI